MSLPWKKAAKRLRIELANARRRMVFWEGMAKGRQDMEAKRELERVQMDAFTAWVCVRILSTALRQALDQGTFDLPTRVQLEKDLAKVNIQDPEQFKVEA